MHKYMAALFHLPESIYIGIHAMVLIATSEEKLNVKTIAKEIHVSQNHLAKVMHVLVKGGFVKSERGPKGGFTLDVKPEDCNLRTIYEQIDGLIRKNTCGITKGTCPFKNCVFGNKLEQYAEDFTKYLENTSLNDFIETQK